MWPYWLLFVIPAFAAATERAQRPAQDAKARGRPGLGWFAGMAGLGLFVGSRLEVGGDWFTYLDYFHSMWGASFRETVSLSDPGYQILNWISLQLDWGVFGTNVIGAAIFTLGLATFCRHLPRPWLAVAVAVPYLVLVVAMGYSRQGIALALVMIGMVALRQQSILWFLFWVTLAATFHKTAILLIPIGALTQTRRPALRALGIGTALVVGYFVFLADAAEGLYAGYIEAEYQSEGALVRLLMNVVPAVLLLMSWRRFGTLPAITPIWRWFAWAALAMLVALFFTPSTTAVDRLALYVLPLQLVVFASLPDAYAHRSRTPFPWVTLVLVYYGFVLFVWLNFATHAEYWLPYRSILLDAAS